LMYANGDRNHVVPLTLFQDGAKKLAQAGCSRITKKVYPGLGHSWSSLECQDVQQFIQSVASSTQLSAPTSSRCASSDEGGMRTPKGQGDAGGKRFIYGSTSPAHGAESFRVLCYGDSNTCGYRGVGKTLSPYGQELAEALQAAGFSCEVTCSGLCGFTSQELANEINSPYLTPKVGPPGEGLEHLLRDAVHLTLSSSWLVPTTLVGSRIRGFHRPS
jgi:hypothetical protein